MSRECMFGDCTEPVVVELFWSYGGEHFGYFCARHRPEFTRTVAIEAER